MSVLRLALLALLFLGGCASEPKVEIAWSHEDYSSDVFAEDAALCREQVAAAVDLPTRTYTEVQFKKRLAQELFGYCLANLGYFQVEVREGSPSHAASPEPAGEAIDIRFEGDGPPAGLRPTLSRMAADGPERRFDLRVDGAPGVAFTAACTLETRTGEEIVTLEGTVPQERELVGRALSCRLLRQRGGGSGALVVEVLRDGASVARSASTSNAASVQISVR